MCLVRLLPGVTDLLADACGATGYLDVLHVNRVTEEGPTAFLTGPVDRADARALFDLCGLPCWPEEWRITRSIGTRDRWPVTVETLASLAGQGFSATLLLADRDHLFLAEPDVGSFTLQSWFRHELGHHMHLEAKPFRLSCMG